MQPLLHPATYQKRQQISTGHLKAIGVNKVSPQDGSAILGWAPSEYSIQQEGAGAECSHVKEVVATCLPCSCSLSFPRLIGFVLGRHLACVVREEAANDSTFLC